MEFLRALWAVMDECWRVLTPNGSVFVNLGDKYATGNSGQSGLAAWSATNARGGALTQTPAKVRSGRVAGHRTKSLLGLPWRFALGMSDPLIRTAIAEPALLASECDHPQWILRQEIIWNKTNGMPSSVRDRCARKHEQWFHFTKSARYYAAIDLLRQPVVAPERITGPGAFGGARTLRARGPSDPGASHPLGQLPSSVWSVATEPLPAKAIADAGFEAHFAAFPSEFPRRIILGWSPPAICDTCGEGLRASVSKEVVLARDQAHATAKAVRAVARSPLSGGVARSTLGGTTVATLAGWACGCNETLHTPTGTRAGSDPSKHTGRAGLNRPRGDHEGMTITTRWAHVHWAGELVASPYRARIEAVAARTHGSSAFAHWIRTDRAGARPMPVWLRDALLRRGWLTEPPIMAERSTHPAVVLDPFGGTGTTAIVAGALGRQGVSIDLSGDYCRIAKWRDTDRRLATKVTDRTYGASPRRASKRVRGHTGAVGDAQLLLVEGPPTQPGSMLSAA